MVEQGEAGGGQPALAVASAHLTELLGSIDNADNRAMFLVGLNVASTSLFVAVLASLAQPWWAAVAPVGLALTAVTVGLWILRSRSVMHFPSPEDLLQYRALAPSTEEVAWDIVQSLAPIVDEAQRTLATLSRGGTILAQVTALQLMSVLAISLVLIL